MNDITRILNNLPTTDPKAAAELLPLVYEELRKLARAKMTNEVPNHTLQATALVHEAYLKLLGNEDQSWANRAHFFGSAARAMRTTPGVGSTARPGNTPPGRKVSRTTAAA